MSVEKTVDQLKDLKSDHITLQIVRKPHCKVVFHVKVEPGAVAAAYQTALKRVKKEVSLPGFRKGKAPDAFIIENYGRALEKEWEDVVLDVGFKEAILLSKIYPLKQGVVKKPVIHRCDKNEGASFTIEFEAQAEIPSIKLEELRLPSVPLKPITEELIQESIHRLLVQFAKFDPIEDRPAQEGDFANIDMTLLIDPPSQVVTNHRVEISEAELPGWVKEQIIGMRPGETRDMEPRNEADLDKGAKPCRIVLHALFLCRLPESEEEICKVLRVQSSADLRQHIEGLLRKNAEEAQFDQEAAYLEKYLIDHYSFEIPLSYVEHRKENYVQHYMQDLEKQKVDGDVQENLDHLMKVSEERAKRDIQIYFLLRKVASQYGITATEEEIKNELVNQLNLAVTGKNSVQVSEKNEQMRSHLEEVVLHKKVRKFLISKAAVEG